MLDHISVPVSNLKISAAFYEKTLRVLGYRKIKDFGNAVSFGTSHEHPGSFDPGGDFWLYQSASAPCKAVHFAFSASSQDAVSAFHQAGIAAGATDNGQPGLREHYHPDYYAAFLIDPDGYNIEAVHHN